MEVILVKPQFLLHMTRAEHLLDLEGVSGLLNGDLLALAFSSDFQIHLSLFFTRFDVEHHADILAGVDTV